MSIQAMGECWGASFPVEAEGVSPQTVRLVALAVADVVNDMHGNEFWASSTTVGKKVGCHRDTVQDALRHLVHSGVLEVVSKARGKPTRFRWVGMAGVKVDDLHSGTSEGESPSLVQVTSPPNTNGTQSELKPVASPPQPKAVDRAKAIVNAHWERVKAETGKKPMIPYMGAVNCVKQAIDDWTDDQILEALWLIRADARPVTMQVLGEYLDGRARSTQRARSSNPFLDMMKDQQP